MLRGLIEIYKIMIWHKKTFPKYTAEGQQIKLRGEAYELIDAFDRFTKRKKIDSRFLHKRVEEETADEMNELLTVITPYVEEQVALFITGRRPLSETGDFVKELEELGIDDLLDIYKEIYAMSKQ